VIDHRRHPSDVAIEAQEETIIVILVLTEAKLEESVIHGRIGVSVLGDGIRRNCDCVGDLLFPQLPFLELPRC